MFAFLHLVAWLTRNREIQNIIDEDSTEFACSHFGIKGESFEKVVLMLSSTEHAFLWNKYFHHLKNFILLINNWFSFHASNLFFSVFFLLLLFFSRKKNIYRTKVAFKRIFDKTCIHVFFKCIIFFSQQFMQMKTFQKWNIAIISVPLKIFGGWLFLPF